MHPLKNGSQATVRPANKPLVGTAGWFTESGENNVPSYPGADWFNHSIAEFQAAIAEMDVVFDPQNDDHLAKAFRGINQRLGAKVMGVINVSEIINNSPEFTLPITPELGPFVTLAGHGAANFTITGFGDACPVGYTFTLLIPRTIANTGGPANSLGNYVQFMHAATGNGLDMKINSRQSGASTLYTYQAYPNANDNSGNLCALFEQMDFLHFGDGRWLLIKLPDNFYSAVSTVEGIERRANGKQDLFAQKTSSTTVETLLGATIYATSSNEWVFAAQFTDRATVTAIEMTGVGGCWGARASGGSPSNLAYQWQLMRFGSSSAAPTASLTATGRWKPNV
ncbi:hypothetical protein [Rheinheimera hassiensis]|uniref:hypothetical protein n=1 Tax=Rheinheimera hassiensis TaxID=1193627 RepID=UPI001F054EBE|nr:hypothetical protein [Rheinheimera hassiensis]